MDGIYEVVKAEYDTRLPDMMQRLDRYRNVLEPYIYNYLIEHHSPVLNAFWATYNPPLSASRAFVLVERRPHPNFAFVLKNIAWAAPTNAIYIFCSDANLAFIKAILGSKLQYYNIIVSFQGIGTKEEGKADYNRFFTTAYSYMQMAPASYIVTVQMDTFFRRKLTDELYVGDYWGNPWAWKTDAAGGGGITVRRVHKMIELCERFQQTATLDNEDSWISDRITDTGGEFPPLTFRSKAIMESLPVMNPYSLHQFWTFLEQYMSMPKEQFTDYWSHLLSLETSVAD